MPLDPSIILAAQAPQQQDPTQNVMKTLAFAQDYKANQVATQQAQQQQQTMNSLKALMATPGALGPDGLPTPETLGQASKIDPAAGLKLTGEVAQVREHQAQTEHAQSETQMNVHKRAIEMYGDGLKYYDQLLADGNTPPEVALNLAKQRAYEEIDGDGTFTPDQKAAFKKHIFESDAAGLRADAMTLEQAYSEKDKNREAAERERHDRATEAAMSGSGTQILHDPKQDVDYTFNPRTHVAETLDGQPFTPSGAAHLQSGSPRSAQAMAVQKYIEENPNASAQDIAKFAGDYQATVASEAAPARAEAAGLTNLTKMRDSVSQAEGNAKKEAGLVASLLDKGGLPGGPSAFGKWTQGARTGLFNDPDASAFQTAVESLKNEYVKVLSTTGGMSGGMSSDAARREADQYINPRLSKEQIRANIAVMERSMQNRTDAINEAIEKANARVKGSAPGGGLPSDLPSPAGHPDGMKAKDSSGKIVALIKNGQWVSP